MRILVALMFVTLAASGCLNEVLGNDRVTPKDIITDDEYDKWVIEIDYVAGFAPPSNILDTLESRMLELVYKDIDIRLGNQIGSRETWSRGALDNANAQHQGAKTGGSTVVTHVMYVDGEYSNPDVLGVAVGHEYVTIFIERLKDACAGNAPPITSCNETAVHTAVLVHEFGHILGLVNAGLKMQTDHEDDEHRGHSDNQNSVMYWAVDTTGILSISNPPTRFDADDKRDACAAGGKGSC